MTHTQEPHLLISYEGAGVGTEIWGMVQANFLVGRRRATGREVAVNLNDAAARFLAASLGQADTPAFREAAAHIAGERYIRHLAALHGFDMESIVTVSRATLEQHPELVDAVRAHFAA